MKKVYVGMNTSLLCLRYIDILQITSSLADSILENDRSFEAEKELIPIKEILNLILGTNNGTEYNKFC